MEAAAVAAQQRQQLAAKPTTTAGCRPRPPTRRVYSRTSWWHKDRAAGLRDGCRCRQRRTVAPAEGRWAAARANTTCSRAHAEYQTPPPLAATGSQGRTRAATTLRTIRPRWPPRAPPTQTSAAEPLVPCEPACLPEPPPTAQMPHFCRPRPYSPSTVSHRVGSRVASSKTQEPNENELCVCGLWGLGSNVVHCLVFLPSVEF